MTSHTCTTHIADYYPFGMEIQRGQHQIAPPPGNVLNNRYIYNGKEYQDDFGLNWGACPAQCGNYGARFYDPQIARWHSVDPLAEKYYSISPYVYVANNPIMFIDPNRMEIVGDTAAVRRLENQANRLVSQEQRRQTRIQARIDRRTERGRSTSRQEGHLRRSIFREKQYQSTINEIAEMRASSKVFNVNTNYHSTTDDGNTAYTGVNEDGNHVIIINVSSSYAGNGGLAHEMVHG